MTEKIVFHTFVSDDYYEPIGTPKLEKSFKRFHPDIDFIVFRQEIIDSVFAENGVHFDNAKPTFAKRLADDYDLVVTIDADIVITDRLEAVLAEDYDVGAPIDKNKFCNITVEDITPDKYIQAGMVASRSKYFWDVWEQANKESDKYPFQEQDILNLVFYKDKEILKLRRKVFDLNKDFYGTRSLGREANFEVVDGRLMCEGERVYLYHNARGHSLPKLQFDNLGFKQEVIDYLMEISS